MKHGRFLRIAASVMAALMLAAAIPTAVFAEDSGDPTPQVSTTSQEDNQGENQDPETEEEREIKPPLDLRDQRAELDKKYDPNRDGNSDPDDLIITPSENEPSYFYDLTGDEVSYNGYIKYVECNEGIVITEVANIVGEVVIPAQIDYKNVVGIGPYAFAPQYTSYNSGNHATTSIDLPNTITHIGYRAFAGCTGLTSITLPSSVVSVETGAFIWCENLRTASIPNSAVLGKNIFVECHNLRSFVMPTSTTVVPTNMFVCCNNLESVTLHSNITQIQAYAFQGCSKLEEIYMPDSIVDIMGQAFLGCSTLDTVRLSNNLESLGLRAFADCPQLLSLYMPSSITSIGSHAVGFNIVKGKPSGVVGFTIRTPQGSTSESYAQQHNITFENSTTNITPPTDSIIEPPAVGSTTCQHDNGTYEQEVSRATCTVIGLTQIKCVDCDYVIQNIQTPMLSHEYDYDNGSVFSEGNCTTPSRIKYRCIICNHEKTVNGPNGNHNSNGYYDEYSSCTEPGTRHLYCTVCGDEQSTQSIPALGHNYVTTTTEPTTTSTGLRITKCDYCDNVSSRVVLAKLATRATMSNPTNQANGINLTWTGSNAGKYVVRRKTGSGGYATVATLSGSTKSYTDTSVSNGVTYTYAILAYNEDNVYVNSYDQMSIRRLGNVTATVSPGINGLTVSWNTIVGSSGYNIYRKSSYNGTWSYIKTVGGSTTSSYVDTTTNNGAGYYYAVRAVNGSDSGTYTQGYYMRLTRPTISQAYNNAAGSVYLKWTANSAADGYMLILRRSGYNDVTRTTDSAHYATSFTGLTRGATYTLYVKNYRVMNGVTYYSAWSAYESVRVDS